jgi:hypothetical protein
MMHPVIGEVFKYIIDKQSIILLVYETDATGTYQYYNMF